MAAEPDGSAPRPRDPYAAPADDGELRPHPGTPRRPAGLRAPTSQRPRPGRSSDRPASGPGQAGPDAPADDAVARRRLRRTVLLGALAMSCAVLLPPVGLVLGIWTVVRALRPGAAAPGTGLGTTAVVLPAATGVLAVLVGLALSAVLALFGSDLIAYRGCLSGANTNQAEQTCQDAFESALRDRFAR